MQLKATIAVAVGVLSATACGYAIKTTTDYDRTVNFANYHTFVVMKGNSSGNPLLDQRATDDVRQALTSKGWAEVPDGQGGAAVVIHAATKIKHQYETFYDNWGGWGWRRWGGIGTQTTFVEDYKVGTVVVDIFDAKSKQAIWHGVATGALPGNATGNAKVTAQAIDKMFRTFPPADLAQ